KDIDAANLLAVKLATQVRPPSGQAIDKETGVAVGVQVLDVVTELQQFAALTRAIDGRALQLNRTVLFLGRDPFADFRKDPQRMHEKFQLPPDLIVHLQKAFDDRVVVYQDARYFAQTLVDDVAWFYGGIATCILPMLYALLGACAYLLRSFDDQT